MTWTRGLLALSLGVVLASLPAKYAVASSAATSPAEIRRLTTQAAAAFRDLRVSETYEMAERAYDQARSVLGPDNVVTLQAGLLKAQSMERRPDEKKALLSELLIAAERRLGPDARLPFLIRRSFALNVAETAAPEQAEPLLARQAADARRVFAPHAEETVQALVDLAQFYENEGRDLAPQCGGGAQKRLSLLQEALAVRGDRLSRHDLQNLMLQGGLSHVYENLSDCADFLDKAEEAKRYRDLAAKAAEAGVADVARTLGPNNRFTLSAQAALAKIYRVYDRDVDALRQRDIAAAALRKRYGEGDPDLIELELGFVDCHQAEDCKAETRRQRRVLAERAAAFDLAGADAYTLYAHLALAMSLPSYAVDDGFAPYSDRMLGRQAEARRRTYGPSGSIPALRSQYELRRKTPALAASAIDAARQLVAAQAAVISSGGGGVSGEGDADAREASAAEDYRSLADAAWLAGGQDGAAALGDEAYRALQQTTAGSVNKAMALSAAQKAAERSGGRVGEFARRRAALSSRWAVLNDDVVRMLSNSTPGAAAPTEALRRREAVEQEAREIDGRLRREFPAYFTFLRPEPMSIAATQAMLRPDEAILLALPARRDQGVHLIAISKTAFAWRRSATPSAKLQDIATRLLWLSGADVGASPATERKWIEEDGPGAHYDRKRAYELYLQLVAPVDSVLSGKRHVFVVSGGWLSRLPFGILVAQPPAGNDADPAAQRATRWLADTYALSVIPSVRALQVLRAQPRTAARDPLEATPFVGFGDPVLGGVATQRGGRRLRQGDSMSVFRRGPDTEVEGVADVAALRRLARLPGTAAELEDMRAVFGARKDDLYLEARATETAVKHADLSHARVVAFATHGLLAGELRGGSEPGLVLTPPPTGGPDDDGLLTASEVTALELDADWVILSACNTASGDGSTGSPGLSGLARAFFYAGARSLLVSHWPVRDDVASRLTVSTVRLQREHPSMSRAEALQQAMRDIRNDADAKHDSWAEPEAWAPFSLVGDGAEGAP